MHAPSSSVFGESRTALIALALLFVWTPAAPGIETVQPVDLGLAHSGRNYDDLCFWRDPADVEQSLVFVTSKDVSAVEVFELSTGAYVTSITGFSLANNCDVVDDLLVTTDSRAGKVMVDRIPSFERVHAFTGFSDPQGVSALDRRHVYVTEKTGLVRVLDLDTLREVTSFDSGFTSQEGVVADAQNQHVFIANDAIGRIRVFTAGGTLLTDVSGVFGTDAEGLAIYRCGSGGYLLASDQSHDEFEVFDRLTLRHLGTFLVRDASGDRVNDTDGIDIFQAPTARFPAGVFGACDSCSGTGDDVDLVRWERIASALGLDVCPDGVPPSSTTTTTEPSTTTITTPTRPSTTTITTTTTSTTIQRLTTTTATTPRPTTTRPITTTTIRRTTTTRPGRDDHGDGDDEADGDHGDGDHDRGDDGDRNDHDRGGGDD